MAPGLAFAQLTPPAGSLGAGPSGVNGVPYGPANPAAVSDPAGFSNASRVPPLAPNPPLQSSVPTAAINSLTIPQRRRTTAYVVPSSSTISANVVKRKSKKPRRRGHVETSSFTGICRGC
jgi:hypothetical protein